MPKLPPVAILDHKKGLALAAINYGPEHNLIWVTAIDATGEIWCAPNPKVRLDKNWTLGRGESEAVANEKAARKAEAQMSDAFAPDAAQAQPCADCAPLMR